MAARSKEEIAKLRVTADELLSIDEKAYELNITRSEYMRRLIFGKDVIIYDFSALDELTAGIGKIGVNINQIAKKLNQGGELEKADAEYLRASLETINEAIKKIYEDTMAQKNRGE
ncbi:MAG: plasmid mobilization relaxosome protein MobC [Eubacteriales bacterium]|nr:plasmid mobilization relaxosome protein MobC [Eubacteriales bacterium]